MFDSSLAVPLHFTVEFVGFLVAAGGAFLVASRPALVPGDPGRRRLVALGFGALAVAHVAHGGAFLPSDGGDVLTLIRAIAFALMLVGLAGRTLASPATVGASFQVQDPLPLLPGGLALLAAAAAFHGSLKGGPKTNRRLSLGLFLFALSEVFVAAAPTFEFGVGELDTAAYISHALKVLAYIAVGSWLWSGVRSSIRTRFVASFVTLLVVVVLALATSLTSVIATQIEDEELKRVDIQLGAAFLGLKEEQRFLVRGAEAITDGEDVRGPLTRGESADRLAGKLFETVQNTFQGDFVIVDGQTGVPGSRGVKGSSLIQILGSPLVEEVKRTHIASVSIQSLKDGLVMLAVGEVASTQGSSEYVGTVILGRYLGQQWTEGLSRSYDPAQASLIVGGKTVASQLPRSVAKQRLIPEDVQLQLTQTETGQRVRLRQAFGNKSYFTAVTPIRSARGEHLGVLAFSNPASIVAETRQDVTRVLFLVAMAAAAIALALAWYSGRRITRPIQQLTATARSIREGNLEAQAPVAGEDEVGQLGETFNGMTLSLLRLTEDLRLAAREEQHLRGRIETIIESMADGLVAVDANRNVLAFNREAQHLTGLSPEEALGRPVQDVLSVRNGKGDPIELPIYNLGVGSTGGVFIRRSADDMVPVAVTSAALSDGSDQVAGAVAVIRDMTREREIERMKSEFLSNISHELRTPLTPIKGYAEILTRKEVPPDKIKRFTQGILDSTSRLERIVELLVDFSAMEAGRLTPKSTPVDLADMVRKLGEQIDERASRHEVVMDIKSRLPKVVGDERLLRRSLEEILDNAVKFSPQGGTIKLEVKGVSLSNGRGRGRGVAISIHDEGIGIEPENLEKIFSDFHQLDGSETRAYGGLGLGLAFVQRIIEAHEGQVEVDSRPDTGTCFTVTLPGQAKKPKND